jgi:GDP/UDP-N,N'-diacetylbacillosamine 2-epimerase (hydrolysing)
MRKIFIVTERRADYSRFQPILKLIQEDPNLDYDLVVTGLHVKPEHGLTINEIKSDGFSIFKTFEMFLEEGDSGATMVRAYAEAVKNIATILEKSQPDLILSGFDIAANAAVTLAGAHMNIPVAHIQGGEVTGTIDESIRHSMTKFAHYHFAANEDACERLVKLGELPNNVFNVGCPSIDAILNVEIDHDRYKKFGLTKPYFLILQHPVTTEIGNGEKQIMNTIEAINESNCDSLVILPNNDAGYSSIIEKVQNSGLKIVKTLSIGDYVNLLREATGLVGNSSSGIHEAASFNVPVVNIGTRQQGRLRPKNVIDVGYDKGEIAFAMKRCEQMKNSGMEFKNPYGDGNSATKIVEFLKAVVLDKTILQKRITY